MRIYAPSRMQSAKDQPGHTKLKYRQDGQSSRADIRDKDLRAELEDKERKNLLKKTTDNFEEERLHDLKLLEAAQEPGGGGLAKVKPLVPKALDADDDDSDDDDSESDEDDDEDDEAELLAELERIKKERAEEAAKKQAADAEVQASERQQELVRGNPLLDLGDSSFQMKRRWDDDVVFKNQARGEPKLQKRFINDTIRSDFHRRFLNRYIK